MNLAWIAAAASVGCSDALSVTNQTSPDVSRVYGSTALIEQLVGTVYAGVFSGLHGSSTSLTPQVMTLAFENYGTVANFGMNAREGIPRRPVTNEPNNVTASENFRDFDTMQRRARDAANAIMQQDRLLDGITPSAANLRTRAFAWFALGVAQGSVGLMYDSAAIITPKSEATPPLSAAKAVVAAGLAALDSAIAQASAPAAAGGFPLPATWTNRNDGSQMTQADFVRLLRSYKAIFRAGVARTPAERAAVDWNAVIADATNGITADYVVQANSGTGWPLNWEGSQMFASNSGGWHQMPMYIIGMADTSGGFDAWVKTAVGTRQPFLIRTPDKRFPSGETRAAQQAVTPTSYVWDYSKYPYMRNRNIADTPAGDDFGNSFYDFYRFKGINQSSGVGPWVNIAKVEIDMLAAEGYCRTGNAAAAATLIDKSRTKAGLPALSGVVTNCVVGTNASPAAGQPVPGGDACVPRIVVNNSSTKCGDMWEAMKWEKRMETAYTGYLTWFLDSRGWGDLAENTNLEYPTPYQELQARRAPLYGVFGGAGGASAAAKSTYGY
jgi:hypothetical protein